MLAIEDHAALEGFLPLFLEQALEASQPRRVRSGRGNKRRQEIIPDAVMMAIAHLCDLDLMNAGVQFSARDMTAAEARGLALLRRARENFCGQRERCECGAVNLRNALSCLGCGRRVREASGG
jgi:hypothetical protein